MNPQLSAEELEKVQRTIRRRLQTAQDANIVAVGFGAAFKRGKRDPQRPFAVTVFVRRKKKNKALKASRRVPKRMEVRVKRGNKYETLSFCTDVLPIKKRFLATGKTLIEASSGRVLGTGSIVVSWRKEPSTPWQWGILTTGHFLKSLLNGLVDLLGANGTCLLTGKVIWRTTVPDPVDAAIVWVAGPDLVGAGLLPDLNVPPDPYWLRDQLVHALQTGQLSGVCLSPGGNGSFDVDQYVPTFSDIDGLGTLRDIIVARSSSGAASFQQGTSGSSWQIAQGNAGLQVAGLPPSFSVGAGQILDTGLQWAAKKLKALLGAAASEFRFVRAF